MLGPNFPVLKKDSLNKDLKKSLSLSESEKYFNEIYFSKIRAPKMEREEKSAFREILGRNQDLTLEELKECFQILETERDKNGEPIKAKFAWLSKGLDRILLQARDNLIWAEQIPDTNPLLEESLKTQDIPTAPEIILSPDDQKIRTALLPALKSLRSELIASEYAYLENSEDDNLKYQMTRCREAFEEFLVKNENFLSSEVKRYTDTEQLRFRDVLAAISRYAFTGRVNLASTQAVVFKIIQEQQMNWYTEIKNTIRTRGNDAGAV